MSLGDALDASRGCSGAPVVATCAFQVLLAKGHEWSMNACVEGREPTKDMDGTTFTEGYRAEVAGDVLADGSSLVYLRTTGDRSNHESEFEIPSYT